MRFPCTALYNLKYELPRINSQNERVSDSQTQIKADKITDRQTDRLVLIQRDYRQMEDKMDKRRGPIDRKE